MINTKSFDQFVNRHIGINEDELPEMLRTIGEVSLDSLINKTIPPKIRLEKQLELPEALTEYDYLQQLKKTAALNKAFKSYIGLGYYGTITPSVILRNVFENPGWYTQYTPYQAEISQGRLEALLNFQTLVSDLTGLPIANGSLLDEGTAAAEAMHLFYALKNKRKRGEAQNEFLVSDKVFPQTIDVLLTRAKPLGIQIIVGDWKKFEFTDKTFGVLLQYPDMEGSVENFRALVEKAKAAKIYTTVAADLLSLALLSPPGEWGADAVVGNTQRFGVPLGFGGPHAAYFATTEKYKRLIPGRIIGVSLDKQGNPAFRMALQTREQHIRREKATSNICTAQALLAIMASMYAVYHGPKGIKAIAEQIHTHAKQLDAALSPMGFHQTNDHFFDTLCFEVNDKLKQGIQEEAEKAHLNFYYGNKGKILISVDETTGEDDITAIAEVFAKAGNKKYTPHEIGDSVKIPSDLQRQSEYLTHPVFNTYQSETKMMRYIKRLENRDLSLTHSMIPLGSCTMKLNAATEMLPVSWPEFSNIHPFVPKEQVNGYLKIFEELESWLCEITGFAACSLQPNSGAQGEFSGLLTIRAFHEANGEGHRNVALIPSSAHGTNPASAVMAGMKVVVVKCAENGDIDVADLKVKAEQYKDHLAALIVTYPSTHGVFEEAIKDICHIIHENGGKVYMDGANMNAQVGFTSPAAIGADVCHLNLHKTFAVPHGGGGPGMGPICVNESLAPFLPNHTVSENGGGKGIHAVSAAPYGSSSILLISHAYIRMLGSEGLIKATEYAILNANYIKAKLEKEYPILYVGKNGYCAHELIVDLQPYKSLISAEDVAKRLIDYGFHAPTLSFPVAGTIMIEPTESEDLEELDRFCNAMLCIKNEIEEIASGEADPESNVLVNSPHTAVLVTANEWNYPYSREKAAYPLPYLKEQNKFWPSVARIDNAYGDRNLVCTCPPMEEYVGNRESRVPSRQS
ncbi:MAG: aminomethyl-transferring glycine dehydrogenase [Bacteroidetes bacterium]|nr:aminomethyl-transferring glycine dehydrogenase [Bacteroidota bacterium]